MRWNGWRVPLAPSETCGVLVTKSKHTSAQQKPRQWWLCSDERPKLRTNRGLSVKRTPGLFHLSSALQVL